MGICMLFIDIQADNNNFWGIHCYACELLNFTCDFALSFIASSKYFNEHTNIVSMKLANIDLITIVQQSRYW